MSVECWWITSQMDGDESGAVKKTVGAHVYENLVGSVRGNDEFNLVPFALQHLHLLQRVLLRVKRHTAVRVLGCKQNN